MQSSGQHSVVSSARREGVRYTLSLSYALDFSSRAFVGNLVLRITFVTETVFLRVNVLAISVLPPVPPCFPSRVGLSRRKLIEHSLCVLHANVSLRP